jgi:hypothetical protein
LDQRAPLVAVISFLSFFWKPGVSFPASRNKLRWIDRHETRPKKQVLKSFSFGFRSSILGRQFPIGRLNDVLCETCSVTTCRIILRSQLVKVIVYLAVSLLRRPTEPNTKMESAFENYSLHSFISIILAFGVVTKEQNKITQFTFNDHVLNAYDESQARNIQ